MIGFHNVYQNFLQLLKESCKASEHKRRESGTNDKGCLKLGRKVTCHLLLR